MGNPEEKTAAKTVSEEEDEAFGCLMFKPRYLQHPLTAHLSHFVGKTSAKLAICSSRAFDMFFLKPKAKIPIFCLVFNHAFSFFCESFHNSIPLTFLSV